MNQNETLRAKQLSRAIVALSNGIKAKEVKQKPKNLDFLNLPKPQKPKVIDAKKNLDYLQKLTGLPIPKKEVPKEKDLKFVDKLKGISHSEITQDVLVDRLHQKIQPQVEAIKADFLNEIGLLRSEALQKEADKLVISDELVKVFLQKLKNLPENEKLDVTDLRNFQSFIFGNKRYGIDELLHGGGSGNGKGLDVLVNGVDEGILENLNFVDGTNMTLTYSIIAGIPTLIFNSTGGGGGTFPILSADLSPQANGVNTIFTIPVNTSVVSLMGTDSPIVYRQGVDYNVSGTTLTLTGTVNPPSLGATLILEYTSGVAAAFTSDLSSQCNGSNLIFTIPTFTTILSLVGTDAPIIYRPLIDFTASGTTLTLMGVNPPSLGATLLLTYV